MENEEKRTFTREELYELVWTTPMLRLARRFGLSDVGLAKACRRHSIPTPKAGHWAKKRHGKIVRRISLPPCDDPALATITFARSNEAAVSEPPPAPPPLASTFFDPELGRLAEIEARGENPIVVPDSLRLPHPLVERTREGLIAASKDKSYHRELVLFPRRSDELCCLDVRVGPLNIGRAMRIMDALIKGLEKRGHKVSVPNERYHRGTHVEALGDRFQIQLREPTVRQNHIPTDKEREWLKKYPGSSSVPKWDYVSSNQLLLELQGQYSWNPHTVRDGKKKRVEDGLSGIPMTILRLVDDRRREAAIDAERARVRAEAERQRRDEEERRRLEEQKRKEEQARIEALFGEAERWHRCRQLREYLEAIRGLVNDRYGFVEPDSPLDCWLKWADEAAERSDPLVALKKEIDTSVGVCCDAELAATSAPKPR